MPRVGGGWSDATVSPAQSEPVSQVTLTPNMKNRIIKSTEQIQMKELYLYELSCGEIERLDLRPFLTRFGAITSADRDELLRYCNALVLTIGGYDTEPEELYAIPEVRRYFRALTDRWPFWLFFLHFEAESSCVPVLSLLPSVASLARKGYGQVAAAFDPNEMGELLIELFPPMNLLCDRVQLGEDYIERRTIVILRKFFGREAAL